MPPVVGGVSRAFHSASLAAFAPKHSRARLSGGLLEQVLSQASDARRACRGRMKKMCTTRKKRPSPANSCALSACLTPVTNALSWSLQSLAVAMSKCEHTGGKGAAFRFAVCALEVKRSRQALTASALASPTMTSHHMTDIAHVQVSPQCLKRYHQQKT